MKNTIYKTYAIDNASIVRMEAQGHTEKESLEFCKMDLINDQARKEIKDYWDLKKFRFETIIVDNK
jgi:type VI protein secretion system component Hcp